MAKIVLMRLSCLKRFMSWISIGGLFAWLYFTISTVSLIFPSPRWLKISNLYRGISYPLITNSFLISLQFGIYDNLRNNDHSITTSASAAGLCLAIVSTPIDCFKIRRQTFSKNIYKNPFVGILPTIYREIPANIIYFNTYYRLKNEMSIQLKFENPKMVSTHEIPDEVKIVFPIADAFKSAGFSKPLKRDTQIAKFIPPQLGSEAAALQTATWLI